MEQPFYLDLRSIYAIFEGFCDRDTEENKALHEFLQMMKELSKKYNGDDGSLPTIMTPLYFLVNFSQNLVSDHSQRNI